jgi:signal transduction histidine kinase
VNDIQHTPRLTDPAFARDPKRSTGTMDDLVALADPERLERVLLNLLSAAVASSPERGHVDVEVARPTTAPCASASA